MSSKYQAGQFIDPKGSIIELAQGEFVGYSNGVPSVTDGYAPGAIVIDVTNGVPYRNIGTLAANSWASMVGGLVTADISLTVTRSLHDGRTIVFDEDGSAVTLPAMTGTGAKYRFVWRNTVTSDVVITATGAHLFGAINFVTDTGAGTLFTATVAASTSGSTTITANGTTTGGRKGDWLEIEDIASGTGIVRGQFNGSGTEATPFA
jgi:hypothetical protein